MPNSSPAVVWKALTEGNARFVAGEARHEHQDLERRTELVSGQSPHAVVLGCGDSRVPVELLFDQGFGDVFVVRTAGHTLDAAVIGSVEYGVAAVDARLVVVLGHESCGAVKATVEALETLKIDGGWIRDVIERVAPSVLLGRAEGLESTDDLERRHAVETSRQLVERSRTLAEAVEAGTCSVVAARYQLGDGKVELIGHIGDI